MVSVSEFPPTVLPSFIGIPLDGGRVQSISVNPGQPRRILVANEFGGIWASNDRGGNWSHVYSLDAVSVIDVAWSPDGDHVIATLGRDTSVANGGGIWVSSTGTYSWSKPASADPPANARVPARMSAYGISWATDAAGRVYVGTDFGVAISSDYGATWIHRMLETTSPVDGDKLQNAAVSILALPANRVIALSRTGAYRSDDGGDHWRRIRAGNLGAGFKSIDLNPLDPDKVFVIQDYSNLHLYEVGADRWSSVRLPGGDGRGQFVRVSRSATPSAFDVWYGAGAAGLRKATCGSFAAAQALTVGSWTTLWRPAGLHDDSGYLGLDEQQRPILYGSDGGIFRPTNITATTWERAATGQTGLNSFQITDVAGTNLPSSRSVYFSTQDNAIWASADGGSTWPNSDCTEGFFLQVPGDASSDAEVTVAYGKISCGPSDKMMSDANLVNQRAIPDVDEAGNAITGLGQAFYVSPGSWVRFRTGPGVDPELWVSDTNGASWRHRFTVQLGLAGIPQVATVGWPFFSFFPENVYAAFGGQLTAPDGSGRIGLIRFRNLFAPGIITLGEADLIYLPDRGSLGVRATMFDWHAIFGVDPQDPGHLIAPDVVNQVVKVSVDHGRHWTTDADLTDRVTDGGRLRLYDADPYHVQVTQISFDPYVRGRILVGTRDAGVIYRETTRAWTTIGYSGSMRYVTGFFFQDDNQVIASTYGRGLWKIDFRFHFGRFPYERYCKLPCFIHWWDKPRWAVDPPDWRTKDVLIFLDGRINGIVLEGDRIETITIAPGTRLMRYRGGRATRAVDQVEIVESDRGWGFDSVPAAFAATKRGDVVTGVIMESGRIWGVLSAHEQFVSPRRPSMRKRPADKDHGREEPEEAKPRGRRRPGGLHVMASTTMSMPGLPVVGPDGVLYVVVRDESTERSPELEFRMDGEPAESVRTETREDGASVVSLAVPDSLPKGQHVLDVVGRSGKKPTRARVMFVTAWTDEGDEGRDEARAEREPEAQS
jgi:hypothetical protein